MGRRTDAVEGKDLAIATEIPQDAIRKIFRIIFSGDNCLFELFPRSIIVGIEDLRLLNKQLEEKLSRHDTTSLSFSAVASYENGKSQEYGTWMRFTQDDWSSPDVLNSLSLTWRFMVTIPGAMKPSLHCVNVRIAAALNPQHLIQALFSKDPEDIDRIELKMVSMSTRIDFVDHILSQELLDLISKWNIGLRIPEHVFPFMKWVKQKADHICGFVRRSLRVLTAAACFSYFVNFSRHIAKSAALTFGVII